MKYKYLIFIFCLYVLIVLSSCSNETTLPPSDLRVNLISNLYFVDKEDISFSWVMNDRNEDEIQTAYRVVIACSEDNLKKEKYVFDSNWIDSNQNTNVVFSDLYSYLDNNKLYCWKVASKNKENKKSQFSDVSFFSTNKEWTSLESIWASNVNGDKSEDDFCFVRSDFDIINKKEIEKVVLSATASSPEPSRQFVYNIYINDNYVGMGPSRIGCNQQNKEILFYNSYDVTDSIEEGSNSIGAILYTTAEKKFLVEIVAYYKDGTSSVLLNSGRDYLKFKSLEADRIFQKSESIGTGYYIAHSNNIDATKYPFLFSTPGFDDSNWNYCWKDESIDTKYLLEPYPGDNVYRYKSDISNMTFKKKDNSLFVDFGKEVIGGIHIKFSVESPIDIVLHYGEELDSDGIVKYNMRTSNCYEQYWKLKKGTQTIETYDLMAYRYLEIMNINDGCVIEEIYGIDYRVDFDESKTMFDSSNELLNKIYELLKYTSKETTQDLLVDSQSRERAPYEGDLYINQLLIYAIQGKYSIPRFTIEYLLNNPTWPAEYLLLDSEIVINDYLETGDTRLLNKYYDLLKDISFDKYYDTNYNLVTNGDGTDVLFDYLIDWPEKERDEYDEKVKYYTVFNSLASKNYENLAFIAKTIGNNRDYELYKAKSNEIKNSMIKKLYNSTTGAFSDGVYSDGAISNHYSQHATAYALAMGIYESEEMANKMAEFLDDKIKMSIYGTFFLLKGLYDSDNGDIANKLLLNENPNYIRTMSHIINDLGVTIAPEAWDQSIKNNMTFSHPWGSCAAYAIKSGIFGIKPTKAGYEEFDVKIQCREIEIAKIEIPSIKGMIKLEFSDYGSKIIVDIPTNTKATLYLPNNKKIYVNGKIINGDNKDGYLTIKIGSGEKIIELV